MRQVFISCIILLLYNQVFSQIDSTKLLNEVTVAGARIRTGFDQESANVIHISKADIQKTPSQSVADLLHYYAGIDVRQQGANGVLTDIGIRGSTFNQVLVLVNGVKMSDQQTGHFSMNLPVDIENIERIEIVKGPAARVYGQNAFAGAINIITKNSQANFLKLQATGGDFGLGGGKASGALTTGSYSQYASIAHDFSSGYRYNTDYKITNYFYTVDRKLRTGKLGFIGGFTDKKFGANGFYGNPSNIDQYEALQTSLMALTLQSKPNERLIISQRLYWRRNQDEYIYIRSNPAYYRNLHINNTLGYDLNASYQSLLGITGFGVDVSTLKLVSNNLGNRDRTTATFFVEHRFQQSGSRWDVTPGVQLNYYSDLGTNFLPGVDVGYRASNSVKAFGNLGYTYRVPTYTDLYYKDPKNIGNPDLKPEYAVTYEAGLKLLNLKWLSGQISYFNRNGKQIIDYTKQAEQDPWQTANFNNVTTSGIDMNFAINPQRFISSSLIERLTVGYTYMQFSTRDSPSFSKYALQSLNHQVVASLQLKYTKNVFHSINYRYADRVALPNFSVIDSRLGLTTSEVTIFIDVTNIFDVPYTETSLIPLPGRWTKVGLAYTFKER
jgi:iron complex outermembrane receptor protein